MRRANVADWIALEDAGLLHEGQIRPEAMTRAAVLLVTRCSGRQESEILALDPADLWGLLGECVAPFPGPQEAPGG